MADAGKLDLAELRSRREEAEEADISYLRRLLQGRLDILRAKLVRRSQGGEQDVAGLLAGLPAILTDDAPGTFSAIPRILVPSRADQHRRRVERLVHDETIARLRELDVEELTGRSRCSPTRRRASRPTGGRSSAWWTCSGASWRAATGTAGPRSRSSSNERVSAPVRGKISSKGSSLSGCRR